MFFLLLKVRVASREVVTFIVCNYRTHFETYNRPHFVIWEGRFYKTSQVYSTGSLVI